MKWPSHLAFTSTSNYRVNTYNSPPLFPPPPCRNPLETWTLRRRVLPASGRQGSALSSSSVIISYRLFVTTESESGGGGGGVFMRDTLLPVKKRQKNKIILSSFFFFFFPAEFGKCNSTPPRVPQRLLCFCWRAGLKIRYKGPRGWRPDVAPGGTCRTSTYVRTSMRVTLSRVVFPSLCCVL